MSEWIANLAPAVGLLAVAGGSYWAVVRMHRRPKAEPAEPTFFDAPEEQKRLMRIYERER